MKHLITDNYTTELKLSRLFQIPSKKKILAVPLSDSQQHGFYFIFYSWISILCTPYKKIVAIRCMQ